MKVTIDRFEGNYAVVEVEEGKTVDMPIELVPDGAIEGTVLSIEIDSDETEKRKENINKLRNLIFNK